MNANFSDVGTEITGSLPRDGQAAMTGQLKASSGTAALPSVTFSSDTNTGLFNKSADVIGVSAGGVEVGTIDSAGFKDSNNIVLTGIPTGAMMMYGATAAPTGWLRCNGLTVGNASSSATERANADTSTLFAFLWNNYSNSVCAVSSGRGASAAADYAANKTIALPDLRGRAFFGLDDMGGSAASRLGSVITSQTTNGSSGGAETVTLAQANLPNATLTGTTASDGAHTHNYDKVTITTPAVAGGASGLTTILSIAATATTSSGAHTHTFTTSSINGGVTQTATANMPPAFLTTFIIKL
jgi:microcystin-dependent protein